MSALGNGKNGRGTRKPTPSGSTIARPAARIAFASVPPQPKPPHPAARRPARATPGGHCRHGPYPPKRRWRDGAGLWAIPRAGKMRAQAVSATSGRHGSLPYPTIARGARTARTIATSGGGCIGPRISTSSRRSAPALGHRKHGEGAYPLSPHSTRATAPRLLVPTRPAPP